MNGTVIFDGSTSVAFDIRSGVKQGCLLAPTLFGILFAVLRKYAFGTSTKGIYLRTRSDGKLFNLTRLKAITKTQLKLLRDFLFADDAAVIAYSSEELQQLMRHFSEACKHFGLTINLKKTQVMGQGVPEVVHDFVYLGSRISDTLSLDIELNRRIGKASTTMSSLTKRVWKNGKLTENTKIQVYRACVLSTPVYGSESWVLHARHEHKLNTFHLRNLRRILNIAWQDKVPNTEVIERENLPSMYSLLKQRRLR